MRRRQRPGGVCRFAPATASQNYDRRNHGGDNGAYPAYQAAFTAASFAMRIL